MITKCSGENLMNLQCVNNNKANELKSKNTLKTDTSSEVNKYKEDVINNISINNKKEDKDTSKSVAGTISSIGGKLSRVGSAIGRFANSVVNNVKKTFVTVSENVKNTVSKISTKIKDTFNEVTEKTMKLAKSVEAKITDTAEKISATVKQVTATAAQLKDVMLEVKDSATSLVTTGVKTAVKIGAEVGKVVTKVGLSVANIKRVMADPSVGIIGKVSNTVSSIGTGFYAIKEGVENISGTVKDAYKSMSSDYKKTVEGLQLSVKLCKETANTIVTCGKEVAENVKTIVSDVKTTASELKTTLVNAKDEIADSLSKGINNSVSAIKEGYTNIKNDYNEADEVLRNEMDTIAFA